MTTAWTTDVATDDVARAISLTLFWGLDGVSLRGVGGERVPNVNEAPLRRRLEEADLPVVALDPGLFEGAADARAVWLNDLVALDDVAAFGRRVGCDLVRVGALSASTAEHAADALRQAGARAAQLGLRLAVRNDASTSTRTGAELAALLQEVDHPAVGADWRPADALVAGEAPAEGLAALVGAGVPVLCVGVRDGTTSDGLWNEATVGDGIVGWDRQLAALAEAGFDGPLVIDDVPAPARKQGLGSATALIQQARRAVRDSLRR